MKKSIAELKKDIEFSVSVRGRQLTFRSTWGLFSPQHIDEGSRLFLEHIEIPNGARVLDVGCGYGALGIAIAATVPGVQVEMLDKDIVAVAYAKKNIELNGLKNCTVYESNLLDAVPEQNHFDVIVSNVPAKGERELYDILLHDAKQKLVVGGIFCIVSVSGLREFFKKNMSEVFGNYTKVKQGATYTVSCAAKEKE